VKHRKATFALRACDRRRGICQHVRENVKGDSVSQSYSAKKMRAGRVEGEAESRKEKEKEEGL